MDTLLVVKHSPSVCTIDRLDFSNETISDIGDLSQVSIGLAGVSGGASYRISGSRTYGYFGGGGIDPSSPPPDFDYLATVDRLDFSNETFSAPGNNLSQARSNLAATESNSYGYFAGGFVPPQVCTIDRLDFSNETISDIGDLSQARSALAAVSSSSYGYFVVEVIQTQSL